MTDPIVWLITTFLSALFGSAFGGYFGKRGEIRAVKERLSEVIAQNEAITKANEAIKDQLASRTWERQRQWEMRRDAVSEIVQSLGHIQDLASKVARCFAEQPDALKGTESTHPEAYKIVCDLVKAKDDFEDKSFIVSFMCGYELRTALTTAFKKLSAEIEDIETGLPSNSREFEGLIATEIALVFRAARKELGLEILDR